MEKKRSTRKAAAGGRPARPTKKPIEQYEHTDKKRAHIPPVGLVTPDTDPPAAPQQYRGTVSLPFEKGRHGRAAVKIVDDRGIESLRIVGIA